MAEIRDGGGGAAIEGRRLELTRPALVLLATVYLVATANVRFFSESAAAFPPGNGNLLFLLSLPLLLGAVLAMVIGLFGGRWTVRPFVSLCLVVGASVAYFSDRFGVIVDSTMLRNVLATDSREVTDLLNVELLARVVLLGIVPAVLVWWLPLRERGRWRELRARILVVVGSFVVLLLTVLAFSSHYASFFREYKSVWHYANPISPLVASYKVAASRASSADTSPPRAMAMDATLPDDDGDRELLILVVGETARADHFSLYGYERQTNPLLSQIPELFVYRDVQSCGTSTAISVPCMFALEGRADFDPDDARHEENVLDVLARSGVSVLWRDNNSDSKGVALRVPYEDYRSPDVNPVCDVECRDVGMLDGLQEFIDASPGDVLIVLHQMGNHGPAYFKRYPAEFERFTPACDSIRLSDCSPEEITNAYDNAILYTDWFLTQVIEFVKRNSDDYEAAMLYVSDHGESLGEHNIYLHGLPDAIAPDAQRHVPMLLWVADGSDVDEASVLQRADIPETHDAVAHSLMAYFELQTEAFDSGTAAFTLDDPDPSDR